ncbi:Transcriptional antiterminator [Geosporobacter subterraneus DSM 17957]|uniref:Transcriptional antiterminator n=1 Tax=Geosporobacter subterraneus DSM 17957 TaxID=1121919 RepID=A0A1M6EEB2_9FIRM|nr:BglG family transcription antiterminator [Geosporobacter subterraneus]SHI83761.1 Transcriptional antiterminator [Geosporobacter subterraneus DSM 17957]
MISSRQRKILEQLVQYQDFITVEQLAKQYDVSHRTIRHDILTLESSLKRKEILFIRHRKHGLKLELSSDQLEQLHSFLDLDTEYLSPESRAKEIAKALLENTEINFEELLEVFKISNKTLVGDLNELKSWFKQQHLKLVREKGKVKVLGREFYKRKAYLYLLKEETPGEKILDYLLNEESKIMNILQWKEWFQPKDMHYLFEVVSELEQILSITFSDNGYVALILHMYLSMERLMKEYFMAMDEVLLNELSQTEEFKVAEKVVKLRIEPYFQIHMPLSEIGYITQHILTAQKEYQKDQEDEACLILAKQIVIEAEKTFEMPLLASDQIIESLAMHLKPAIYRAKYGIKIYNPLFSELQKNYRLLLDTIVDITNIILAPKGIQFDEQEVSYIAMHIGAGIQQPLPSAPKKRVAIVCSSGLGTVNILQRRLLDIDPEINIVKKCSYKDLKDLTIEDVDLIISTIDIYFNLPITWLKVSPLLMEEDEKRVISLLGLTVQKGGREPHVHRKIHEIMKLIERNADIKNRSALTRDLIQFFEGTHLYSQDNGEPWKLTQLLPKEAIQLQADTPATVEEMIRLGTGSLKKRGIVGIEYEDKLIQMLRNPNHHFVITEGVIFPHAANETGVWGTGFSLTTFKRAFVSKEVGVPVWLMITLAAEDNEKHVEALALLIDALNDESFLTLLKNTHQTEEIYEWFERREGSLRCI